MEIYKGDHHALHYLETSGVNHLAEELPDHEWNNFVNRATKVHLCIFPVTLWEVLLNTNEDKRDQLIYWMQFNCADKLLKTPSEILIDYIERGLPRLERRLFAQDPWTKQQIGETWTSIHGKIDRKIPVDLEKMKERAYVVRELSKKYGRFMDDMVGHDDTTNDRFHDLSVSLLRDFDNSEYNIRRVKTGLVIGLFLLCMGVEISNSHLTMFWAPTGVDNADDPYELRPFERLEYLVDKHPLLFVRGPLLEMANMMSIQREIGGKMNRGAMFDVMHSVYCYYCGNTITEDPHFIEMKKHTTTKVYEGVIEAKHYVHLHKNAFEKMSEKFK